MNNNKRRKLMITITDVIGMKKTKNVPFRTKYHWLFQTIENDLISKSNGAERVKQLLSDYDYSARLFIVHQFQYIGEEELARELFTILGISSDNTFLEDIYVDELIDDL
jgi:hypothetical protein